MVRFEQAVFDSPEQRASVELRDRVLRKPLGLKFSAEDLVAESSDHHLIGMEGTHVLAVLLMRPLDNLRIKMRQVAVAPERQGSGLGSRLVEFAEQFAADRGFRSIEMHARTAAVPFYEKLGYHTVGAVFTEVGIDHLKMVKDLDQT